VLNNLPVEPLQSSCDVLIGVNCNHLPELAAVRNVKNLLERAVMMNMNFNAYSRKSACTYFIEAPGLGKFGVFDLKKAPEFFQAGYSQAMKVMEANPSLLEISQPLQPQPSDL
jgi:NTE family protein